MSPSCAVACSGQASDGAAETSVRFRTKDRGLETSPTLEASPTSQPARGEAGDAFLDAQQRRTAAPLLERDLVRCREVVGEHALHLRGELATEHDRIDLVVVGEAEPVEIGRTD